ncbi:MAG: thiamine phosphate synthase [Roseburia sp.]
MDRKRIYAVTNRTLCDRPFLEQIERVCVFGPAALILREKDLPVPEYRELAEQVMALCKAYGVECILHTYDKVALELENPFLHVPLSKLREMSADKKACFRRLGCSVHSVEEALEARNLGAAYLTAGHIYATDCKKGVPPRGTSFLREVCDAVDIPVYAIGGIRQDGTQWKEILSCGAAGGCIMSGMMKL